MYRANENRLLTLHFGAGALLWCIHPYQLGAPDRGRTKLVQINAPAMAIRGANHIPNINNRPQKKS